jgi:hypothetical protein
MAIVLTQFFGGHSGTLSIYVGVFSVGSGNFTTFTAAQATFSGSYNAFGQSGAFTISVEPLTAQSNSSGTCKLTLNATTDNAATYQINGNKLTVATTLNRTPVDIYPSQGGTQIDGISGHNLWIGQWA